MRRRGTFIGMEIREYSKSFLNVEPMKERY